MVSSKAATLRMLILWSPLFYFLVLYALGDDASISKGSFM